MKGMKDFLLVLLFLPVLLAVNVIRSDRSIIRKIGYLVLVLIIGYFIWWTAVRETYSFINYKLYETGITDKELKVKVSGDSMLPTIKDGDEVTLSNPRKTGLQRGDIVSFANKETGALYYIKRIVGLPGEEISIKNGGVYIDKKLLDENYTLNRLPTFGNSFLPDCEIVKVPDGHYFVSGDNRTVSFDSRAIGFVDENDIEGVIDTRLNYSFKEAEDKLGSTKASISPEVFLKKLNEKRVASESGQLVTHKMLNDLAKKRSEEIRDNFDDWKRKSVPVEKLLEGGGYRYNLVHEFVTFGYLSEEGIVDQIFDSPAQKAMFGSPKFTEVGIGVSERKYQDCQYPVISIILSWPSVPTYDPKVVDSWNKEVAMTAELLSNMQSWVGIDDVDQEKVRELITLAASENEIAARIYKKMKNREWLTSSDYQDIKKYDQMIGKTNKLVDEFFGKVQGVSIKRLPLDLRRL